MTQNLNNLITDNLDIWTSVIKSKSPTARGSNKTHELYGIKKLRELILWEHCVTARQQDIQKMRDQLKGILNNTLNQPKE